MAVNQVVTGSNPVRSVLAYALEPKVVITSDVMVNSAKLYHYLPLLTPNIFCVFIKSAGFLLEAENNLLNLPSITFYEKK